MKEAGAAAAVKAVNAQLQSVLKTDNTNAPGLHVKPGCINIIRFGNSD